MKSGSGLLIEIIDFSFFYWLLIGKKYLNKKTKEYDKEFLDWLKAEQLEELFGSLANFTKYACC